MHHIHNIGKIYMYVVRLNSALETREICTFRNEFTAHFHSISLTRHIQYNQKIFRVELCNRQHIHVLVLSR